MLLQRKMLESVVHQQDVVGKLNRGKFSCEYAPPPDDDRKTRIEPAEHRRFVTPLCGVQVALRRYLGRVRSRAPIATAAEHNFVPDLAEL